MVAGFEERRRAQGTFLEISTYLMGEVDFSFCRQYCQQLCVINIDGDLLIKNRKSTGNTHGGVENKVDNVRCGSVTFSARYQQITFQEHLRAFFPSGLLR